MNSHNFIVYIINLNQDKDRRSYVEKELKRVGIDNYSFISAIDGSMLPQNDLDYYNSSNKFWPKMSPGQVGCSMSHVKLYKDFLDTKYDYALVLEDDISFRNNFNVSLIDDILFNNFPKNHIILLNEIATFFKKSRFKISKNFNLVKVIKASCTSSYLIDKYAAEQLIRKNEPIRVFADDFNIFQEIWHIDVYGVDPFIAEQNTKDFDTTIHYQMHIPRSKMKIRSFFKFDYYLILRLIKIKYEFLRIFRKVNSHTKL
ncbi:glycosyltransferase family 25 protein [Pelagibacterales bacterium]|nr:glycosyltransferase family 25 protein [Pelagibacterales bacterium]